MRQTPLHLTRRGSLVTAGAFALSLAVRPAVAQSHQRSLLLVGPWEINALEPARSGYLFTRTQVVETLTEADDAGRPLPGLATRWTTSAEGLVWRFELRPTARFHDGTPVSAAAVVGALQRALKQAAGVLGLAGVQAIEAEGAQALRIRLAKPFAPLPAVLAHSSVQILAPASYAADGTVTAVIGSGPYRITSLPPQQYDIEAFDGFDGPKPAVRRVRFLSAGRSETRTLMAESGQADLAFNLDAPSLQRLRQRGRPKVLSVTLPRTISLKLNSALPHFGTAALRQAFSLSIDRAGIARALLRDPEMAATQLLPPILAGWHQPGLPSLRHDPAAALAAFAAAGWRKGGDGTLQREGQPLRLKLRTYPDRPELPQLATALQAQWRSLGIACEIAVGNSSDIPSAHRDGSLELGLMARNYVIAPDPLVTLWQDFGSAPGAGSGRATGGDWGAMNWQHAGLQSALESLARGVPAERVPALRAQVAQVLQDELPLIPIAWYRQHVAVSERLDGVSLDPLERSDRLSGMRWR